MDKQPLLLDRSTIVTLLNDVAREAVRREIKISMFLVGGAAMALAYSTARVTRDVDGMFEPKAIVYEIARMISRERTDLGLAEDWLNDAAKSFMPGNDPDATVVFEEPGLSVRVASPRYLFVMKAMAGREADLDDLRMLYRLAGYQQASQAIADVALAYPIATTRPSVQYLIEGLAEERRYETRSSRR